MFSKLTKGPARAHVKGVASLACAAALLFAEGCGSYAGSASVGASAPAATSATGLTVTGGSVTLVSGPEGGPFPDVAPTYRLRNTGTSDLTWTAFASADWLRFARTSGTLAPGATDDLPIAVDQPRAARLAAGDWPASITLSDTSGQTGALQLGFLLRIEPVAPAPGELALVPDTDYVATGTVGGPVAPAEAAYRLSNAGEQTLRWGATSTRPWLSLAQASMGELEAGESVALALVLDQVQLASLAAGTYTARLILADLDRDARVSVAVRVVLESAAPGGPERVTDGLVALYDFSEGTGATVRDRSALAPALDLTITDPGATHWLPGALQIEGETIVRSNGPATKVHHAVMQSGELTIEAWLRPRDLAQDGPARIVTLSDGAYLRNFTLGQGLWGAQPRDTFNGRLRTTSTDLDGEPLVTTGAGSAQDDLQHVVYTFSASGAARIFVDADVQVTAQVGGDLSGWSTDYRLGLANEFGASRPWFGELHLVAVFDRALGASEVEQNFAAGPGSSDLGRLVVTPLTRFQTAGVAGSGPFQPGSRTYTLTNPGGEAIDWSVTVSHPWLTLSTSSGTLAPGAQAAVDVHVAQATANGLPSGTHDALIALRNDTNGFGSTSREARLTAQDPNGNSSGAKPGPTNTGPTDPSALISVGAMTVTTDGAVIENVRIGGTLTIAADDVIVRNFIVDAGGAAYGIRATDGNTGIVIEDGEVENATSSCVYGGGFTARRLNVHESGGDGFKTTGDVLVEACWIHHLGTNPGAHADGNQTRYGSHFVFRGNNFDMPITVPGPYKSNAALIIQTGTGPVDDVLIEDNWLCGGNFTVYIKDKGVGHGDPTNCRMLNNRFGRDYRYGVLSTTGYVHIEGNVWDDTGASMPINNH